MSHDAINNWVEKAKSQNSAAPQDANEVKVIKRQGPPASKGNIIMDMSEKLRPWLLGVLSGLRDENGMLLQPAHVRAIALNVAQSVVTKQEENTQH